MDNQCCNPKCLLAAATRSALPPRHPDPLPPPLPPAALNPLAPILPSVSLPVCLSVLSPSSPFPLCFAHLATTPTPTTITAAVHAPPTLPPQSSLLAGEKRCLEEALAAKQKLIMHQQEQLSGLRKERDDLAADREEGWQKTQALQVCISQHAECRLRRGDYIGCQFNALYGTSDTSCNPRMCDLESSRPDLFEPPPLHATLLLSWLLPINARSTRV